MSWQLIFNSRNSFLSFCFDRIVYFWKLTLFLALVCVEGRNGQLKKICVQGTLRFSSFHHATHKKTIHVWLFKDLDRLKTCSFPQKDALIPGGHTVLDSYIPHILQFAAGTKSVPWFASGKVNWMGGVFLVHWRLPSCSLYLTLF